MRFASLLCLAFICQASLAAPKAPEVGYIYPPGGKAGTTVNVQLAGFEWTPDLQFFFSDRRVKLELLGPPGPVLVMPPPYWFGPKAHTNSPPMPREIPARLTLPADLPIGPIRWQVANANGGSANAGVFWVSATEAVLENDKAKGPQRIETIPAVVQGRLFKIEEIDSYRFRAVKSGPVTCELLARRLGANFDGVLEVRDASSRVVADVADTEGNDPALTFAAKAGEEYTISLRDVDYRGDRSYVYRLEITPGPRVLAAHPPIGKRGEKREVEFVGYGLATGQPKLETLKRQVTFPDTKAESFSYRLETPHGLAPAFRIFVSDQPETLAAPSVAARPLTIPAFVSSCMEKEPEDRYVLQGKKGDRWSFTAEARRFDSPLDMALTILGSDGKELARGDDQPGTTDAALAFTVPADGDYTLVVSDVSGKAGNRAAVYRLTAEIPEPDFTLTVAPRLSVPLGDKANLVVNVVWHGPIKESVDLRILGLPAGVTAPEVTSIAPIDPKAKAPLAKAPVAKAPVAKGRAAKGKGPAAKGPSVSIPITCEADAAVVAARIQVVGTATESGKQRTAQVTIPGNLAPRSLEENHADSVLLAVTMKSRCKVVTVVADGGIKVNRGATYPAELTVERLEGFTGEISLQMASMQSYQVMGITGPDFPVPPGASKTFYPCFMPEWLETTRTSRMILVAVVQVPDPKGNVRHLVTDVQGRITMSIEGALLKLTAHPGEINLQRGKEIIVPVRLARASKLTEPVKLELIVPDELQGLLKMTPVILNSGKSEALLRITTVNDSRLTGEQTLTLRATAIQRGNLAVVSEATVQFMVGK